MDLTLLIIEAVDFGLLVSFVLALIYLHGPRIRRFLQQREKFVRSCGGGIAASYVFLQLFPEVEVSHKHIGDSIHFISLISFVVLFGMEEHLHARSSSATTGISPRATFWMHVGMSWAYTWAIVFALPDEIAENLFVAIAASIAIGVHTIYKDYTLHAHHADDFESAGRFVLVTAPLTGWLIRTLVDPSELIFDVSIAILIGALLQNVFKNELSGHEDFDLRWFVTGVIGYAFLVTVIT